MSGNGRFTTNGTTGKTGFLSACDTLINKKTVHWQKLPEQLKDRQSDILAANAKDIENARQQGLSDALIDRLLLTESRLDSIIHEVDILFRCRPGW